MYIHVAASEVTCSSNYYIHVNKPNMLQFHVFLRKSKLMQFLMKLFRSTESVHVYIMGGPRNSSGVLRKHFVDKIVSYLKGKHDPDKKFR